MLLEQIRAFEIIKQSKIALKEDKQPLTNKNSDTLRLESVFKQNIIRKEILALLPQTLREAAVEELAIHYDIEESDAGALFGGKKLSQSLPIDLLFNKLIVKEEFSAMSKRTDLAWLLKELANLAPKEKGVVNPDRQNEASIAR